MTVLVLLLYLCVVCCVSWMEHARHYHPSINGSVVLSAPRSHSTPDVGGWLMAPANGQILGPGKNPVARPFFFGVGGGCPKLAMGGRPPQQPIHGRHQGSCERTLEVLLFSINRSPQPISSCSAFGVFIVCSYL